MSNKRYRLSEEEERIILHLRETGTVPDKTTVHSDKNTTRLHTKYNHLKKLYTEALAELDLSNDKLEILDGLKSANVKKPTVTISKPKGRGHVDSQSVAIAVGSDWHLEERVDPDTVNGLNEYDMDIARARIHRFFEKALYLVELMRGGTRIDAFILALLGDLMSGGIHEELLEINQVSSIQSLIELSKLIREGIDYLLENGKFDKIVIPCCFGNHSRTTKKKRIITGRDNSFETLLYEFLAMIYDEEERIEFIVPKGYHVFVDVFDRYLIRFHHGDAIRYYGGVGGISIPVNKAIAQWNRSKSAYLDVFGHFHQTRDGGSWLSNGSGIGYNAYGLSIKADYEAPQQTFFLIESEKGKTFTAPIILDTSKVHC